MQHVVCVSPVSSDLQTGQNPGGVLDGSPPRLHHSAGSRRFGAQYPLDVLLFSHELVMVQQHYSIVISCF